MKKKTHARAHSVFMVMKAMLQMDKLDIKKLKKAYDGKGK
jgi:hypothetical protein